MKIENNSNRDISDITEMLENFLPFAKDAYLRGNMTFRDWEDNYKQTNRAFGNSLNERRERLYHELKRRLW